MPFSVKSQVAPNETRSRAQTPGARLLNLANRPEADWQAPTLRIPHEDTERGQVRRARVSTTQVGVR